MVLEYAILQKSICFGTKHSVYNMTLEELGNLLYLEYQALRFEKEESVKERILLVRTMSQADYKVIPLENLVYIKTKKGDKNKFWQPGS